MSEAANSDLQNMWSRDGKLQASHADLQKPERHTLDILGDEFPSEPAPNNLSEFDLDSPLDTRAGVQPQTAARQLQPPVPPESPQTAEDAERDAIAEEIITERLQAKRMERVQADIAQQFISTTPDFRPTPANAALLAETMRSHGLPMTPQNLKAAWESVKFAADPRTLDQYTVAELKAADHIEWTQPPAELLQPTPAPARQAQATPQPSGKPPCAACGQAFEAHTADGRCPGEQPQAFSGLPDRQAPVMPIEPDVTSGEGLRQVADKMASMSLEQARAYFVQLAARTKQQR